MSSQVKNAYNQIAKHFAQSRQKLYWPEIEVFLSWMEKGFGDKKANVLDLGCGSGRLLNYLAQKNVEYTGMDLSDNLVKEAQKNHPHYKFLVGQMQDLSAFKNGSFDYIFLLASFHHLETKAERIKTLQELKRILKPEGLIFMTNWNLWQNKSGRKNKKKGYRKYIWQDFWQKLLSKERAFNDTIIPFGVDKIPRYYHAFHL